MDNGKLRLTGGKHGSCLGQLSQSQGFVLSIWSNSEVPLEAEDGHRVLRKEQPYVASIFSRWSIPESLAFAPKYL